MAYLVAVDAGTTGIRALALDEHLQVTAVAYRELVQHYPRPGWVEHDAAEIWAHLQAVLSEVTARIPDHAPVAAIGITNQRETVVAWDRRTGRPLHRAIVWQDRRTAPDCEALARAGHLPLVRRRTGLVLDPYFSATKAAWLLREGGLAGHDPARLAIGTVDSWVLWNLSGGPDGGTFATDPSNASRTLLFDIERLAWDPELCDLFAVPAAVLPEVRPSCGRLARVARSSLPQGAEALAGVPVSGLAGDQHAALFGQACFEPGDAKVTYGTGSFLLVNAGHARPPTPDGILATVAWDLGDRGGGAPATTYALEGSAFTSGAAIQWLRDGLGLIERSDEVGPLAESVPDSGGVAVVPALAGLGSPWWDPRARGTVTGITRGAGRAQLARAVVESMAFEVRGMADAVTAATGRPLTRLRADGGAAAMALLLQLQADQLGVEVARPVSLESTALGAAALAGLAEGVFGSLDDVARCWRAGAVVSPRAGKEAADVAYAGWLRSVDRARGWAPG